MEEVAGLGVDVGDVARATVGRRSGDPVVAGLGGDANCPISVRTKVHQAEPMTLDQALARMELVGHDFYLYVDAETSRPSVVYRRHGWSYGVIHLDVQDAVNGTSVDGAAVNGTRVDEPVSVR